jgi:hypothetical protein
MKKHIFLISFLFSIGSVAFGQTTDALVTNCVMNAGSNAKYLKDFRIQLGKATVQSEFRYKTSMSLWKNTKYRFSLCNSEESKGRLILIIKDESNKIILSSYDPKTEKTYPYIDFFCNKSGIYQLNYDFVDGEQGSGVGVVSMLK